MGTPNHKYWVNAVQPLERGSIVALCRYSPEAAAKGTLKACSVRSLLTFYSPKTLRVDTALLSLPRHFVRVPSNVTPEKMALIISRSNRLYAARRPPGPRTAGLRRR